MTDEEAIKTLKVAKSEIEWEYPMDYQIALDKAIRALEKESVLDKIYANIQRCVVVLVVVQMGLLMMLRIFWIS